MEYRRVDKVEETAEDGVEVSVFFKGTTYVVRKIDGELRIVDRMQLKQQEDPYYPEDGRVLSKEDYRLIIKQAGAIIASRQ